MIQQIRYAELSLFTSLLLGEVCSNDVAGIEGSNEFGAVCCPLGCGQVCRLVRRGSMRAFFEYISVLRRRIHHTIVHPPFDFSCKCFRRCPLAIHSSAGASDVAPPVLQMAWAARPAASMASSITSLAARTAARPHASSLVRASRLNRAILEETKLSCQLSLHGVRANRLRRFR